MYINACFLFLGAINIFRQDRMQWFNYKIKKKNQQRKEDSQFLTDVHSCRKFNAKSIFPPANTTRTDKVMRFDSTELWIDQTHVLQNQIKKNRSQEKFNIKLWNLWNRLAFSWYYPPPPQKKKKISKIPSKLTNIKWNFNLNHARGGKTPDILKKFEHQRYE